MKGRHGGGRGDKSRKPITVQRSQPLHPEGSGSGQKLVSPDPTSGGAFQPPNQGLNQLICCRPDINAAANGSSQRFPPSEISRVCDWLEQALASANGPGNTWLPPIYPHSLETAWKQPGTSLEPGWNQTFSCLETAWNYLHHHLHHHHHHPYVSILK